MPRWIVLMRTLVLCIAMATIIDLQQAHGGKQVTYWHGKGNRRRTILVPNKNEKIAGGKQFKSSITNIINKWKNDRLTDKAGTLVKTKDFRIDMQGMVNKNGQRYHNLQIQKNVARKNKGSTTYALVLVPKNEQVPEQDVKDAFLKSFEDQVEIKIKVDDHHDEF